MNTDRCKNDCRMRGSSDIVKFDTSAFSASTSVLVSQRTSLFEIISIRLEAHLITFLRSQKVSSVLQINVIACYEPLRTCDSHESRENLSHSALASLMIIRLHIPSSSSIVNANSIYFAPRGLTSVQPSDSSARISFAVVTPVPWLDV